MRIAEINTFHKTNFCANIPNEFDNSEEYLVGLDNDYKTRDLLRERIYARTFGYIPECQQKQTEFARTLDDVYIKNYKNIGNNSRCGASLMHHLSYLDLLPKTQITKIIDLEGYSQLRLCCKDKDIDYYHYKVNFDYLLHPIFKTDEELITNKKNELSTKSITKSDYDKKLESYRKYITRQRHEFVQKFYELTQQINSGNFYISCDLGEIRTPLIVGLNTLFNSQSKCSKILPPDRHYDIAIRNMLNNLTDEDKKLLNFTDEQQQFVENYLET